MRHQASVKLFWHLLVAEWRLGDSKTYFHCTLCVFSAMTKLGLLEHIKVVFHCPTYTSPVIVYLVIVITKLYGARPNTY